MMYYKVKVRPHISTHLRGLSTEKKIRKEKGCSHSLSFLSEERWKLPINQYEHCERKDPSYMPAPNSYYLVDWLIEG